MVGSSKYFKQTSSKGVIAKNSQLITTETKTAPIKDALPFKLCREERKVYKNGMHIRLTPKEYEIIEFFVLNPSQVFSKEELVWRFWLLDFITSTKVVDVYLKNLRAKLGDKTIEAVSDTGYRLHIEFIQQTSHTTISDTTAAAQKVV